MSEQPHNQAGSHEPPLQPPHNQGGSQQPNQPPHQGQPQQPYPQGQPGPQQPGQPPHQQGFPPQGRPQQQYQQQQPGQPQQFGQPQGGSGAPINKSASASFDLGALVKIWVTSFKQFFTGATSAGLDTVRSSNDSPTTKWFWAVAALVNAVLMILVAVVGVLRFSSQSYLPDNFSVGLELVLAVFVPIVVSGVYLSTRALTIMGLFKTQKQTVGFHESANIAAVGFVISAPLLVLALLATALDVKLFFIITAVGFVFTVVFAEVLVYEALKKQTMPESATILHAAFTAVWVSLITYLVSELISVPLKSIATALLLSWLY